MPAVQVRDFPEDAYVLLKDLAARNGRSINQQTKIMLITSLYMQNGAVPIPKEGPAAEACGEPENVFSRTAEQDRQAQERIQRRKNLRAKVATRSYPALEGEDTAALVAQMRAER